MEVVSVVLFLPMLFQVIASAQTAVYVKFLNPPHGYTHKLQIATKGGVSVSREERIYPGDDRYQRLQQPQSWFRQPGYQQNYPPRNVYMSPPVQRPTYRPSPPPPPPPPQPTAYYYPTPAKPFAEYGPPPAREYQGNRLLDESDREYINPGLSPHYRTEMAYDPHLITGPQAAQYVAFLFSQGELFFHLIPHERLVLMNQEERIQNNLMPHILASIRPGHPFFYHR